MLKPAAPYVLFEEEFNSFAKCIESFKTPTGHLLSLEKHIRKKKLGGRKSHDYHVLMQQVLPLVLQGFDETGTQDGHHENVQGFLPIMHHSL